MQAFHIVGPAPLFTNTFVLIGSEGHAVAVDPAAAPERYLKLLDEHGATLTDILLTHGHYDHVGAVEALRGQTGARVHLAAEDRLGTQLFPLADADEDYADGEQITIDDMAFTVIKTPGHSAGSVCLLCGDLLFSGDTLFAHDIGRTDLDGSQPGLMAASLKKLCDAVTENAQVLPGHEGFSEMDDEKRSNPWLQF